MGSQSSSSGWFKQAEQLENERKSGAIPPPPQRIPRLPPKPNPPATQPLPAPAEAATPETAPITDTPGSPAAEKPLIPRPTPAARVDLARTPMPSVVAPRPTPISSGAVTVTDLPDPGSRALRSPFHRPPPAYRRPELRPTPSAAAAPACGRFSLVPDGPGHRLVYAMPGDAGGLVPLIIGKLSVTELRQLRTTLDRYLGAVDPAGPPGAEPEVVSAAATTGSTPPPV